MQAQRQHHHAFLDPLRAKSHLGQHQIHLAINPTPVHFQSIQSQGRLQLHQPMRAKSLHQLHLRQHAQSDLGGDHLHELMRLHRFQFYQILHRGKSNGGLHSDLQQLKREQLLNHTGLHLPQSCRANVHQLSRLGRAQQRCHLVPILLIHHQHVL